MAHSRGGFGTRRGQSMAQPKGQRKVRPDGTVSWNGVTFNCEGDDWREFVGQTVWVQERDPVTLLLTQDKPRGLHDARPICRAAMPPLPRLD